MNKRLGTLAAVVALSAVAAISSAVHPADAARSAALHDGRDQPQGLHPAAPVAAGLVAAEGPAGSTSLSAR